MNCDRCKQPIVNPDDVNIIRIKGDKIGADFTVCLSCALDVGRFFMQHMPPWGIKDEQLPSQN